MKASNSNKLDIYSPLIYYPPSFIFLYFLGSMDVSFLDSVIPVSNYFYYCVALIMFCIGVIFRKKVSITSLGGRNSSPIINYSRVIWISWMLMIVCIGFSMYFYYRVGYLVGVDDAESKRVEIVGLVGGHIFYFVKTIPIISLVLTFTYYTGSRLGILKNSIIMDFVYLIVMPALTLLILMGAGYRYLIANYLFTGAIAYYYLVNRYSLLRAIMFGAMGFAVLVVLATIRYLGYFDVDLFILKLFVEIRNVPNSFNLILTNFPSVHDYYYGGVISSPFLTVIPGIDIEHIGGKLKELFDLHYIGGGFTPSAIGGFYLDFGVIGVIIGFLTIGYFLQSLKTKSDMGINHIDILLYAYFVQYSIVSIRSGVLIEILPLWYLLLLNIIKILSRKRIVYE